MITVLSIIAIILAGIFTVLLALLWFLITRHPVATRNEEEAAKLLEFPPAGT